MGEKLPLWIIGKSKDPRSFRGVDMSKFKNKYPLDAGIIKSLEALSRKFEVLSLLDLMKDSSIHASDLAKNTDSFGRNQVYVEILGPSC
ncbi:hypothetical protein BASA50_010855 [Batrachochytrium salamandrivorans]|uniref:Uncharacterized protein n=1 Tax=Batrachochytrium salamandrivorans TaxID=1357716 RepID=A0ABQ8EXE7_9FUNG|nr:hypothetical protein BASA50_010855 [Batrachochytrium salamandrivorans]